MAITFDQLPQAVSQLQDKLDNIERLLLSRSEVSQPDADKLLTIREAAEFLHLTVPTIYSLVSRAEIPVCKRGKRLYFSKLEVTSWIMAGRKKTVSETDEKVDSYLSRPGRRNSQCI
jgi:excisionase family DNA binding protein